MRFALYLPTYAWPDLDFEKAGRMRDFARKAEALDFDALWVCEHFLVAPGLYGAVWMSPLLCLSHVAAVTTRIRLATGVLVLPYHHPVTLAREIQSLHHLSGGRVVLGVASGWDAREYESLAIPLAERGPRTDEILAATRRLLTERDVSFEGQYYRFRGLTMEPLLPRMPEVWVGGGGKVRTALSPDKTYLDPAVLRRIAGADGWLARAAGTQAMVKADVEAVRTHLAAQGRDPATLRYGHINFVHLVDARDRAAALAAQRPRFERVMGTHRSFDQLQESYFMGSTAEIVDRIGDLERAGIEYLVLAPLDYDLEQLDRIAEEIVPRFPAR